MIVGRVALFFVGLVAGYIGSGIILGPGVLTVLIGLILGTVLAWSLRSREQ